MTAKTLFDDLAKTFKTIDGAKLLQPADKKKLKDALVPLMKTLKAGADEEGKLGSEIEKFKTDKKALDDKRKDLTDRLNNLKNTTFPQVVTDVRVANNVIQPLRGGAKTDPVVGDLWKQTSGMGVPQTSLAIPP